jgi:hypothetical protein
MSTTPVEVVRAWHDAVNAGDVDRLLALSTDDIEVGGPRGAGRGAQLLRDWFGRAGIHLEPRQLFVRGATVVAAQGAMWRDAGSGVIRGEETPASVFVVDAGRVSCVIRYPDLAAALVATGVSEADRV